MANDGKSAEALVQDALAEMERKRKATWVRLYDSRSAGFGTGGNIIPPQPADFVVVTLNATFILEAKSSEIYLSLREAQMRKVFSAEQILGARLWRRAGKGAYCAFYSLKSGVFEVWDMAHVITAYLAPPRARRLQGQPVAHCNARNLHDILYNIV